MDFVFTFSRRAPLAVEVYKEPVKTMEAKDLDGESFLHECIFQNTPVIIKVLFMYPLSEEIYMLRTWWESDATCYPPLLGDGCLLLV